MSVSVHTKRGKKLEDAIAAIEAQRNIIDELKDEIDGVVEGYSNQPDSERSLAASEAAEHLMEIVESLDEVINNQVEFNWR